jgi:hypothetical protein
MKKVNYLRSDNPSSNWKRNLIMGAGSLALVVTILKFSYFNRKNIYEHSTTKISSVGILNVLPEKSLDKIVKYVLDELKNNPDAMDRNYDILAKTVENGLERHPDYANQFIREGLKALEKSNAPIEQTTYIEMFNRIRDRAEERPELMDHFGEQAHTYMEKQFLEKYICKIEDGFKDMASVLKEKSLPLLDALKVVKDYIMKKIEE